jgi:hypothetical protein
MSATTRSSGGGDGRFRSAYDNKALLQVVRDICRATRPDAPHLTTRAQFNAGRPHSPHPDAPTAEQCSRRTGINWNLLRVKATQSPDMGAQMMGVRGRRTAQELPLEAAAGALRIVARRLGVRRLNLREYQQAADEINLARRRAWKHGGTNELLPPATRIEKQVGWDTAAKAAGLAPRRKTRSRKGVSQAAAAERFLILNGYLPTREVVKAWFRASGISIAVDAGHYEATLNELRERRSRRGLWTPARPLTLKERKLFPEPSALRPRRADPAVRRRRWTWEECVEALRQARKELKAGQTLTQRLYQAASAGRSDLPSAGTLRRVAMRDGKTVQQMREEAVRLG